MNSDRIRTSMASSVIIGGVTGGIEAFIVNPLVTIKACRQNHVPVPWSFAFDSKKFDLLKFLYRGTGAHVIGMSTIVGFRMVVKDLVMKYGFDSKNPTLKQETYCAIAGGAFSAVLTAPMELGMTLQQTDSRKKSKNFFGTWSEVMSKCGPMKGLTGISSVALRDGIVAAGSLSLAPSVTRYLKVTFGMGDFQAVILAGASVGTLCAFSTHFLDTIRSVQQKNLRDVPDSKAATIPSVVKEIIQKDGYRGFYRGLFWRTARVAPHVAIVSSVSEELTKVWNLSL